MSIACRDIVRAAWATGLPVTRKFPLQVTTVVGVVVTIVPGDVPTPYIGALTASSPCIYHYLTTVHLWLFNLRPNLFCYYGRGDEDGVGFRFRRLVQVNRVGQPIVQDRRYVRLYACYHCASAALYVHFGFCYYRDYCSL